ncbi:MAG: SPFH domain-containing protein [Novosphingobium sp.]
MEQFLSQYRVGLLVLAVLALVGSASVIIVGEGQQAVITRMGEPHRVINRFTPSDASGAGIAVKIPLVEQVVWLPRSLVPFSHTGKRLRSADQQWLLVDTDVTYRIIDPVRLVETLGSSDKVENQLKVLLPALLDSELGQRSAGDIARPGAGGANAALLKALDGKTRQYGIQIIDLRIARVSLDEAGLQAAYDRMRERHEAAVFAIQTASADDAARITAEAEAEAATRLQRSAAKDPEFYAFFEAMRRYEQMYGDPERKNTATILLPPDSGYLKHFGGK